MLYLNSSLISCIGFVEAFSNIRFSVASEKFIFLVCEAVILCLANRFSSADVDRRLCSP